MLPDTHMLSSSNARACESLITVTSRVSWSSSSPSCRYAITADHIFIHAPDNSRLIAAGLGISLQAGHARQDQEAAVLGSARIWATQAPQFVHQAHRSQPDLAQPGPPIPVPPLPEPPHVSLLLSLTGLQVCATCSVSMADPCLLVPFACLAADVVGLAICCLARQACRHSRAVQTAPQILVCLSIWKYLQLMWFASRLTSICVQAMHLKLIPSPCLCMWWSCLCCVATSASAWLLHFCWTSWKVHEVLLILGNVNRPAADTSAIFQGFPDLEGFLPCG